jgi:hypothetical protein
LFSSALHRPIELDLVDPDPGVAGELQLRLVENEALQQLALEHPALRRLRSLPPQLALGSADRLVQLRHRDDFLVHHGDDPVHEGDALGKRRHRQQHEHDKQGS